jgi:hypothetical protein
MTVVTQKEYARRRKVTPQYINKLVREGKIELTREGKIDVAKADKALDQLRRVGRPRAEAAAPSRRFSATASLTSIRVAHETYKTKLAKLEYERAMGQLLPAAEVLEAQRRQAANLRTRLRRMPRAVAGRLRLLSSEAEIEAFLLERIDEILRDLARDPLGEQPIEYPMQSAPSEVQEGASTAPA